MKLYVANAPEQAALIQEAIVDTTAQYAPGGITIELYPAEAGFSLESDGRIAKIGYSDTTSLLRAVACLIAEGETPCSIRQSPRFNKLGNMVDCSRNAVITVEAFQKLVRMSALMGHNAFMLYTEDTYEIKSEPYFGWGRGRYSEEELQQMDAYAKRFGIELIPCIQTLAHLKTMLNLPAMGKYRDIGDILNVASEDTYVLIDKMLEAMHRNLSSRCINIGMDEAHLLGRGNYLKTQPYTERSEIMRRHLARVVELCRKWGYEPLMWDDMFFRVNSPTNQYNGSFVDEQTAASLPGDLNMIYWDYSHPTKEPYQQMLEAHRVFKNNKVSFAGGAFTWYGAVPQTSFSMNASRSALEAILEWDRQMDTVLITEWGDDAAFCNVMAALPTMQLYSEGQWCGDLSDARVEKMLRIFGEELSDYYAMEKVNFVPALHDMIGKDPSATHVYMLYQDPLQGLWDWHVPADCKAHFEACTKELTTLADAGRPDAFMLRPLAALSHVLELKFDLGLRIKAAYDSGDKNALQQIAEVEIPEIIRRMRAYGDVFRVQWRTTNKDHGLEEFDIRLGGTMYRLEDVAQQLIAYVDGKRKNLPELEEERLAFYPIDKPRGTPYNCFDWNPVYSAGVRSAY